MKKYIFAVLSFISKPRNLVFQKTELGRDYFSEIKAKKALKFDVYFYSTFLHLKRNFKHVYAEYKQNKHGWWCKTGMFRGTQQKLKRKSND